MKVVFQEHWLCFLFVSYQVYHTECSYQGDINPGNLLLDSRYKTPPKTGLDWLNKNANDGLVKNKYQDQFPEKTTFVVYPKKKSKGRAFGGLKTG